MSKEYYVYGAYGLHGELLYIGKGSGISSNKALNRYYFANYQSIGIEIKVTTRMIHQYYVVAEKFFVKNGKNTRGTKLYRQLVRRI